MKVAKLVGRQELVVGEAIIVLTVIVALAAPLIAPFDPVALNTEAIMLPPSIRHPFGTDQFGRDMLSRVLYGARVTFPAGLAAIILAASVGTIIGVTSGYLGGKIDDIIAKIVDAMMAFPLLVLAIAAGAVLGPGISNAIIASTIGIFPLFVRVARAQALSLREKEYVQAAVLCGTTKLSVLLRHIIPNASAPIIVQATLGVGRAIITIASLGFLGIGVAPPTADWGLDMSYGRLVIVNAPWVSVFPGLAVMLVVLGFQLLGDSLAESLTPELRMYE